MIRVLHVIADLDLGCAAAGPGHFEIGRVEAMYRSLWEDVARG